MSEQEIIIFSVITVLAYLMYRIRKSKLTIVENEDTGMKLMVYNDKNKKNSASLLSDIIVRMFKLRNNLIKDKQK